MLSDVPQHAWAPPRRADQPPVPSRRPSRRSARRRRGSGGISSVRDGVWRVDVEISRDPLTGKRRRISRQIHGSRKDAEVALAKLRVADHERRVHRPGTRARTVRAALDAYLADVEAGVVELAPKTVVTTRSACNTMCSMVLADGRVFGDIRLSTLGWQDIEEMFRVMRADRSTDWVRRVGTVLSRGLDHARKHGLIDHNPAKDAARPKLVRRKPHSPAKEDVAALIAYMAMQWFDVDRVAGVVHVAWAVADGGRGVGVRRKPTKRSDWRDVPLTTAAVAAFERQQLRCADNFNVPVTASSYVFSSRLGPDVPHRPDSFSVEGAVMLGARLRNLRRQLQLTLQDVEQDSDHEFKASVVGAYERGERAISVLRLQRLAQLYRVPVAHMLAYDEPYTATEVHGPVTIDLVALGQVEGRLGVLLRRYVRAIEVERGDYNGRVLTIRRSEVTAVASILGWTPEHVPARLDDSGLRVH